MHKKKVSKKKKIAWRKHSNIRDVENFLDDKRLEERLGIKFADKADHELFQHDTEPTIGKKCISGPTTATTELSDVALDQSQVGVVRRRKLKLLKPIKCFEGLTPKSAVQDPLIKRNRVRMPGERRNPLVKKMEERRLLNGILKAKEMRIIRSLASNQERLKRKGSIPEEDLWDYTAKAKEEEEDRLRDEWLAPETVRHTLQCTRSFRKGTPSTVTKKTSVLPAVEAPHPGMSYNPSLMDHRQLLHKVAEKEMELMKQEEHLERVTTKMFSRVSRECAEAEWMEEMSQGLPKVDEDKEKEEADADNTGYTTVNPPVVNKKKTLQQRKRHMRHRQEQNMRRQQLIEKRKVSDIYRLRLIKGQIASEETRQAQRRDRREHVKVLKEAEPHRLSKVKFEAAPLEFNLAEELAGSLRCIRPQGSVLGDRFNSLQKRNVLEPTVRQKITRAKVKEVKKKSHLMSWEQPERPPPKKAKA